jgi:hypothetical protein
LSQSVTFPAGWTLVGTAGWVKEMDPSSSHSTATPQRHSGYTILQRYAVAGLSFGITAIKIYKYSRTFGTSKKCGTFWRKKIEYL